MNSFKYRYSFKERNNDCMRILLKYPNRIPIICEKYPYSINAPDIDKHKYLVSYELTLGQFMSVIRKRMKLRPEIGLYIFIKNFMPSNSTLLQHLYVDFKDADGFLYINYDVENTFGDNSYFTKGDLVYLIKDNKLDKNDTYIIHLIEIIKGGDFHDGFSESHYAYLENTKTKIGEKKMIAYTNTMCGIKLFFAVKIQ